MNFDILLGQIRVDKEEADEVKRDLATTLEAFAGRHPGTRFEGIEWASEIFGPPISSSLRIEQVAANREIFDPPEWLPGE